MKASCRAASPLAAGGWAWDFGIHLSLPHSVGRGHPTTPDLHLTTLYKFIIDLFHPSDASITASEVATVSL